MGPYKTGHMGKKKGKTMHKRMARKKKMSMSYSGPGYSMQGNKNTRGGKG